MIEIELKFEIDNISERIKDLEIIKERDQEDIYYDTPNYDLLRGGNFLRIRNKKRLEFKLNVGDLSHIFCKETDFDLDKLDTQKDIINELLVSIGLNKVDNLSTFQQIIDANKLIVLAPIIKHRTTYKFDDISSISIDQVQDIGLFMENEIMVDNDDLKTDQAQVIKRKFVKRLTDANILTGKEKYVNIGYVELYLLKYNYEVYQLGIYKE